MTYSPNLGRWLQEDPIGFAAGDNNLYRFVGDEPTNYVDPTGLQQAPPGVKLPPPPTPPPPKTYPKGGSRRADLDSIPSISREEMEYYQQLAVWRRQCELLLREAANVTTVQVPPSVDGLDGFGFRVQNFTVTNVTIKAIGGGTAPAGVKALLPFLGPDTIKDEIRKQLTGAMVYEFNSLPAGTVLDNARRKTYDGKRIVVELNNQKIYPVPGADWYITVTGSIEIDLTKGKGSIAPCKKAP